MGVCFRFAVIMSFFLTVYLQIVSTVLFYPQLKPSRKKRLIVWKYGYYFVTLPTIVQDVIVDPYTSPYSLSTEYEQWTKNVTVSWKAVEERLVYPHNPYRVTFLGSRKPFFIDNADCRKDDTCDGADHETYQDLIQNVELQIGLEKTSFLSHVFPLSE